MKIRQTTSLALAFLIGATGSMAADSMAKVTEAVNVVEHGSQQTAKPSPAPSGTSLRDGEFLETGAKSRAELLLPTESVTRLGANTSFNYSVASNTVNLQVGTILFCKPKDASQLNVKTAAVTAGITGTTGFMSIHTTSHQHTYLIGLVEGRASVNGGGKTFSIGAGEILEFTPGSKPIIFAFDVPRMVRTSIFFTKFKNHLPNQSYIDAEVASYLDDVRRGFIQPPTHGIDYTGDIPTITGTAFDSAANSQGQPKGNQPPPPPPSTYSPSPVR